MKFSDKYSCFDKLKYDKRALKNLICHSESVVQRKASSLSPYTVVLTIKIMMMMMISRR